MLACVAHVSHVILTKKKNQNQMLNLTSFEYIATRGATQLQTYSGYTKGQNRFTDSDLILSSLAHRLLLE